MAETCSSKKKWLLRNLSTPCLIVYCYEFKQTVAWQAFDSLFLSLSFSLSFWKEAKKFWYLIFCNIGKTNTCNLREEERLAEEMRKYTYLYDKTDKMDAKDAIERKIAG